MPASATVSIVAFALGPFSLDGFVVRGRGQGVDSFREVFDQIAKDARDLQDARDATLPIDHWQAAEAACSHQADGFSDGVTRMHGDGITDHHGTDGLVEVRAIGEQPQCVSFREDAQEFAVCANHCRPSGPLLEDPHDVANAVFRLGAESLGGMRMLDRISFKMELKVDGHSVVRSRKRINLRRKLDVSISEAQSKAYQRNKAATRIRRTMSMVRLTSN